MEVGRSSDEREDVLEDARETLSWVLLAVLAIGALGGALLTNRAIAPIRDLIETIKLVKRGDISARVPLKHSNDEVETLKRLFNEMLDQIESLINGIKQTTDGVAHDLKTPLTRIRNQAEIALADSADIHDRTEALAVTIEGVDEIRTLLDSILEVTEVTAGSDLRKMHDFQLQRVFDHVEDLYAFVAEENGVRLEFVTTDASLRGDENRIKRALANLVDNALKYTAKGGSVEVKTSLSDNNVLISVKDNGPGIPEADLPYLWDRLYRGDESRSKPGMGLGLSLVKAVSELHAGTVSVESTLNEGTIFCISLPVIVTGENERKMES